MLLKMVLEKVVIQRVRYKKWIGSMLYACIRKTEDEMLPNSENAKIQRIHKFGYLRRAIIVPATKATAATPIIAKKALVLSSLLPSDVGSWFAPQMRSKSIIAHL